MESDFLQVEIKKRKTEISLFERAMVSCAQMQRSGSYLDNVAFARKVLIDELEVRAAARDFGFDKSSALKKLKMMCFQKNPLLFASLSELENGRVVIPKVSLGCLRENRFSFFDK